MQRVLGDIYEGMRLRYVTRTSRSAPPARCGWRWTRASSRTAWSSSNGDVLTDIDLTAELAWHERTGARATLALMAVEDTASYGVVPTDDDGSVVEFREKATARRPPTGSTPARTCWSASVVET